MNTFTIYAKGLSVLFDLIDFFCINKGSLTVLATSKDGLYKDETMFSLTILTQIEIEDVKNQVELAKVNLKLPEAQIYVCEEEDWSCES